MKHLKVFEDESIDSFSRDLFSMETIIAFEFDNFPNPQKCNKIYMDFIKTLNSLGFDALPKPIEDKIGSYRLISIAGKFTLDKIVNSLPGIQFPLESIGKKQLELLVFAILIKEMSSRDTPLFYGIVNMDFLIIIEKKILTIFLNFKAHPKGGLSNARGPQKATISIEDK